MLGVPIPIRHANAGGSRWGSTWLFAGHGGRSDGIWIWTYILSNCFGRVTSPSGELRRSIWAPSVGLPAILGIDVGAAGLAHFGLQFGTHPRVDMF